MDAERSAGLDLMGEPVRRSLYAFVASQKRDVGRDEAARHGKITRELAAFHLDKLVADGWLEVSYRRLSGKTGPGAGRPSKLYRVSEKRFDVSIPQRDYELAARLLASSIEPGEGARKALASARSFGETLGQEARTQAGSRPSRARLMGSLVDVLDARGFEPEQSKGTIRLRNCPFDALAADHRELVCGMNLALQEGLVQGLGASGVQALAQPEPGFCCVALRLRRR